MKEFVYLYPIAEYTDFAIHDKSQGFRKVYSDALNQSIDLRYRKNGFSVNYVIFDGHAISDTVSLKPSDRVIEAGIDFKTHTEKQPNGKHIYPNPDVVLESLPNTDTIIIAGFHLWDCVEKMAQRAYERGLSTMVDEDLTEVFGTVIKEPDYKTGRYPSVSPRRYGEVLFDFFMDARKNKPWLWQDY